jgi:hypothetical protein
LIKEYLKTQSPPNTPSATNFKACIMLVDISGLASPYFRVLIANIGFTSLTEKMAQLGTSGVEEMTRHVNGYFAKLIDKVYQHSGDILKFAVRIAST